MNNEVTIAGIKIFNGSLSSLLSDIERPRPKADQPLAETPSSQLPRAILTVNPEIIVQAHDEPKLKEILNSAWSTIPDGVGILWVANLQGKQMIERITGVVLTQKLLEYAEKEGKTVGIIGGTAESSQKTNHYLKSRFPTLSFWIEHDPWLHSTNYHHIQHVLHQFFTNTTKGPRLLQQIQETDILFIAMGAPKQEYFIHYLTSNRLTPNGLICVAVGGTFDELSGVVTQTPQWIERVGLKWLFRLIIQPWRIGRQLRLLRFIFLALK